VGEWREQPIFVPYRDGHIAGVVTTPDASPRALVLLLTGWGATRSHRGRIWTRAARALADRGIASVRFDYPGIGDSSGTAKPSVDAPPVGEATAVLEAARRVVGDVDVALVGNCIGAKTAFSVAARVPECRAVVGVLLRKAGDIVERGRPSRGRRAVKGALRGRRDQRLKRLLRGVASPFRRRQLRFIPDVEAVLRSRACLLLFLGDRTPADRLARDVAALTRKGGGAGRAEVQHVQTPPIVGFRIPVRLQGGLIDGVVEWLDAELPGRDRVPVGPGASTG
jgi:pimeloyl-ACP methyl ester carboxylesterase